MMRNMLMVIAMLFSLSVNSQSLLSPEQFLGYPLGTRFTTHDQLTGYFRMAAKAMPQMMQLEQYGETYEKRPLLLAVLSDPYNMAKLEDLRKQHLSLANLSLNNPSDAGLPAFVWLSYNVHGNEASSSEVSMKLLYELLSGKNDSLKQCLKNTILIIDPCLNPDGRDRYVNWYNSHANLLPNPDPAAAEHAEPWPSGRGNHYYFDLNRDWVWQTQTESSMRIRQYDKWLPQVHVDFHEQYPGNPYYFAPAAEPYHDAITPWQREFQTTIGKSNAEYFDKNGWLYFTREYFDLFYPGYGDTYPMYNGSIGMTYEQAGHGIAGLAIQTGNDTLTLQQRIDHHYGTSLMTIITASQHAVDLNRAFRQYFLQDPGKYKTYVVKSRHPHKTAALLHLLNANGIVWDTASTDMKASGYDYFSNKDTKFSVNKGDILINAYQQKSTLLRVLFEPMSALSDSATYDITAWALPYAYGLQSYAVKERLVAGVSAAKHNSEEKQNNIDLVAAEKFNQEFIYGCLLDYASYADGKLLAALLKGGIRVRISERDIRYQGKDYPKGSLIVLRAENERKISLIREILTLHEAEMNFVSSGFMESGSDFGSDKVHLLSSPRVAVLTGADVNATAVGELWYMFEQELKYPVTMLKVTDASDVNWSKYDVVIAPDGDFKWLADKDATVALKQWVRQGGRLIALERACVQLANGDWGLKLKKTEEKAEEKAEPYADLKKYGNRERDAVANNIPGAIYKVNLDNTHPMAFGFGDSYYALKNNEYLLEFLKSGWNVGVIKKENQTAGFVGSKAMDRLQDGTVMASIPMGKGMVIGFTDDPVFRCFWENGKLLLTNAVFFSAL